MTDLVLNLRLDFEINFEIDFTNANVLFFLSLSSYTWFSHVHLRFPLKSHPEPHTTSYPYDPNKFGKNSSKKTNKNI